MDVATRDKLTCLGPLGSEATLPGRACKICGSPAGLFDVVDFQKVCAEPNHYLYGLSGVPVYYFRCNACRFLFTDFFDDWTAEERAEFLYNEDYVRTDGDYVTKRPAAYAERIGHTVAEAAATLGPLRLLDFGSGSGHFAACLRERGIDAQSYDPFSAPIRPEGPFDIVTCLEVLQHVADPQALLGELGGLLREGGAILMSTALQPDDIERQRGNWIYVAPRNGHASILSAPALLRLAGDHGYLVCRGDGLQALVPRAGSPLAAAIAAAVGPVLEQVRLGAPDAAGGPAWQRAKLRAQWRGVEPGDRGPFRWTAASRIEWMLDPLPVYPCLVKVSIPVCMEIVPDFARHTTLVLGGETRPVARSADGIAAEFLLRADDDHLLVMQTPEMVSPAELGTVPGDTRKLGLGVCVVPD